MPSGVAFNGIGNKLPAGEHMAHSHMALGKAIAEGKGAHFKGDAPGFPNAILHQLPQGIQMNMAWVHFIEGVDDPNKGLRQLFIQKTHPP